MAKRKIDCTLDEIVGEYLKKRKCEKSRKFYEESIGYHKNDGTKILEKFLNYLKTMETEKENMQLEDLDFEINFGAYQPEKKVSSKPVEKHEVKSKGHERKSFGEEVPKEFIQKIKDLGMKEEDAELLYQTKIDWAAVYSENKIFCTETRCDFYTKIDNEELTKHMISKHKYGEYPCLHPNCSFVGYSKVNKVIYSEFRIPRHKDDEFREDSSDFIIFCNENFRRI